MNSIRKKLFIISYLGNILLLIATFVPIVKFNNQSFAFIDQFFYLSFAIVILVTISLTLTTMKKYTLSLIPNIINFVIISYGIYEILNIEGLKLTPNLSYGIALILYPIGIIFVMIGSFFTKPNNDIKEKKSTKKSIQPIIETPDSIKEPENIIDSINVNFDSDEQIPLSQIINNEIDNEQQFNNETANIVQDIPMINEKQLITNDEELITSYNLNNQDDKNVIIYNIDSEVKEKNIDDDQDLEDTLTSININNLDNNDDLLDEVNEESNSNLNIDDEFSMVDIPENLSQEPVVNIENKLLNSEIPDISINDENLMTNNTQVEDQPKQEFMALNPSDIKVEEKKPIFKKKEKKEDDPLEKIMQRNIPMTLGRTCQFCNTPLGDDERICPICGRIN